MSRPVSSLWGDERVEPVSVEQTLSVLGALYSPRCLVHIGVGNGIGPQHLWRRWRVPHAVLVDPVAAPWLGGVLELQPEWRYCSDVLAANPSGGLWHTVSNAAESGVLPAATLQAVWPLMTDIDAHPCATQTVDDLVMREIPMWHAEPDANWLIVDCLEAASVLAGAAHALSDCVVVWVRVVVEDNLPGLTLSRLSQVRSMLEPAFKLLNVFDELHPAMATAIFVRDWSIAISAQNANAEAAIVQMRVAGEQSLLASEQESVYWRKQAECVVEYVLERDRLEEALVDEQSRNAELALELGMTKRARDIELEARAEALAGWHATAKACQFLTAERDELAARAAELTVRLTAEVVAAEQMRGQLTSIEAAALEEREAAAKAAQIMTAERDELHQRFTCELQIGSQAQALLGEANSALVRLLQALGGVDLEHALSQIDNLLKRQATHEWEAERERIATDLAAAHAACREAVQAREQALLAWHDEIHAKAEIEAALAVANAAQGQMAARLGEQAAELEAMRGGRQLAEDAHRAMQERSLALESVQREILARQYTQHEELVKAEAQIDLIKDLLLREAGL